MSGSLWGSFHVVTFNIIIFLLFMAHARAVFTDPGIVPLPHHRIDFSDSHSDGGSIAPKEDWTICTRCEMYRPPRAHHCRICKHCIKSVLSLHQVSIIFVSSQYYLCIKSVLSLHQ